MEGKLRELLSQRKRNIIKDNKLMFTINRVEVDEIIEIPLNHLIDKGNSGKETITRDRVTYTGQVYHYKYYLIWGATVRILRNFFEVLTSAL